MRLRMKDKDKFQQLAIDALLELCTNNIGGKHVTKIEGNLSITVNTNEVFCVIIKETLTESDLASTPIKGQRNGSRPSMVMLWWCLIISFIFIVNNLFRLEIET